MKRCFGLTFVFILAALGPTPTRADDVVFSNLASGPGDAYESTLGYPTFVAPPTAPPGGLDYRGIAMSFEVGSGSGFNLTQIDLALSYNFNQSAVYGGGNGGLTVTLYGSTTNPSQFGDPVPAAVPLGEWTLNGPVPSFGPSGTQLQTISGVSGITLDANTVYWIGIETQIDNAVDDWNTSMSSTEPFQGQDMAVFLPNLNMWFFNDPQAAYLEGAFDVLGTAVGGDQGGNGGGSGANVPEPSSLVLLGFGLMATLMTKRRVSAVS